MSALAFNLLRIAYLVLLWLFVLFAIGVLRRDLLTRARDNTIGQRRKRRDRGAEPAALVAPALAAPVAEVISAGPPPPVAGYSVGGVALPPDAPPPAGSQPKAKGRKRNRAVDERPVPSELVVTSGSLAGTRIPLTGSSVLIGRAPSSTLVINDDFASSRHARIFTESGEWFLEDLGSTNGTFVAGQRVTSVLPLTVGSTVQIGQSMIELR